MKPDTAGMKELRERLYQHVLDTIDWGVLDGYEQVLWSLLPRLGYRDEDGSLAETMVRDAIVRAASDPMRTISDVPWGVTVEERRAVRQEPDCPLCQAEETMTRDAHEPADDCPCCADMATDWRMQHEAALRKAGLWRAPPS